MDGEVTYAANSAVRVCGYKLLIALMPVKEKTKGGLYVPETTAAMETIASVKGIVVQMGPDAYKDESRFPNGAYCQVGDVVLIRSYAGSRIKIGGEEFRIVNDDSIEGVVLNAEEVERG